MDVIRDLAGDSEREKGSRVGADMWLRVLAGPLARRASCARLLSSVTWALKQHIPQGAGTRWPGRVVHFGAWRRQAICPKIPTMGVAESGSSTQASWLPRKKHLS